MAAKFGEMPRPRPVVVGGRSLRWRIDPAPKPFDHDVVCIGAVTGTVFGHLLITDEDAVELMNMLYNANNPARRDNEQG